MDADELNPEERSTLSAIQQQKKKLAVAHRLKKGAANNQALLPRRADAQRLSTTTNLKVGRPSSLGAPGIQLEAPLPGTQAVASLDSCVRHHLSV